MLTRVERAIEMLTNGHHSIVVLKDESFTSDDRGIKPIMNFLRADRCFFADSIVADKLVGKAAALLFVLGKAQYVYGEVMSEGGKAVLENAAIGYSYGKLVPQIINRTGDDICPMEKTVADIDDPAQAYVELGKTIERLKQERK